MLNQKEKMEKTAELIDVMIKNAESGPSGFWTEDYEGCGNPKIFPEFDEGLKHCKLIYKEHYHCPWNTTILYGGKRDRLVTGCYHNCSIAEARYLTPKMIRRILLAFKNNMRSGTYSENIHSDIKPLILPKEMDYIKLQKETEKRKAEKEAEVEYRHQVKISSDWIKKYLNKFDIDKRKEIKNLVIGNYRRKHMVQCFPGIVFFNPEDQKSVVGAEDISYDEFLYIQLRTKKYRHGFLNCYMNVTLGFKGCIEKINKHYICFKRIHIDAMFPDGECFEGKEDHVWMSRNGFEDFKVGDSVSFFAEVYRYIKKSNGKTIEYGLRNPECIQKIDSYELPSEKQLMEDEINRMICETCYLESQCSRFNCMRNRSELNAQKNYMMDLMDSSIKE